MVKFPTTAKHKAVESPMVPGAGGGGGLQLIGASNSTAGSELVRIGFRFASNCLSRKDVLVASAVSSGIVAWSMSQHDGQQRQCFLFLVHKLNK